MEEISYYLTLQKAWDKLPGPQIGDVESPDFCLSSDVLLDPVMVMFGLIELSVWVARYYEGKSQGLSFGKFDLSSQ